MPRDIDYPPVHILNALRTETNEDSMIAFRPGLAPKLIKSLDAAGFVIVSKEFVERAEEDRHLAWEAGEWLD